MYSTACVVNLHFSTVTPKCPPSAKTQATQSPAGTCCGILLDTEKGLVLAHASCLSLLLEKGDLNLASLPLTLAEDQRLSCEVLLQVEEAEDSEWCGERVLGVPVSTMPADMSVDIFHPKVLPRGEDSVTRKTVKQSKKNVHSFERFPARMISFFHCPVVKESLQTLMPPPAWELLDRKDAKTDINNNNKKSNKNSLTDTDIHTLLSSFVIIKLQNWQPYRSLLQLRPTKACCVGERVEICSTPFGGLKPEAFINSYSQGIISNLAGKDNCLLLSDARCIFGGEGAPLYTFEHSPEAARCLTGVVIASLCWKNEEWVGFCVACDIGAVIDSAAPLLHHLHRPQCPPPLPGAVKGSSHSKGVSCPEVVMLKVGSTWGSGVVVDRNTGTILTCSHVVKEAYLYPVEVQRKGAEGGEKGKVVYQQQPLRHQFDLAVVQASSPAIATASAAPASCRPLVVAVPAVGMEVFVVGHALFGAEHHLPPSVTSGVISKIIRVNKAPVMIQTTCAVHPGASGGALVDTRGRLLAVVVCNTRDNSSGASFPHINMSIPVCSVWHVITRFLHSRDASHLETLSLKNSAVDTIWALGSTQDTGMIPRISKL